MPVAPGAQAEMSKRRNKGAERERKKVRWLPQEGVRAVPNGH